MATATPLETTLKYLIHQQGPMTIARFMELALYHPQHGYYMRAEPFGEKGDFVTSPEISQLFGEMIGVWLADFWLRCEMPTPIRLIEVGPGKGTLMSDILRATKNLPGFHSVLQVVMVEVSPRLTQIQKDTLKDFDVAKEWKTQLADIPEGPFTFIVGNEFLDALPIHQCVLTDKGWFERGIALDKEGALTLAVTPMPLPIRPPRWEQNAEIGSLREICPAAGTVMKDISRLIYTAGGACLFIDYGYADAAAHPGTLQALKNHKYHPVLEQIGEADITAHVDFLALKDSAEGAGLSPLPLVTQGTFLTRLGIHTRVKALEGKATREQKKSLQAQVERLIHPSQMGTLFKVFCATSPGLSLPSGFDEE